MKCVENVKTGKVTRVTDEEAQTLTFFKWWRYVPKAKWKAYRDDNHQD